MARRSNHGRDIESDILRVLANGPLGYEGICHATRTSDALARKYLNGMRIFGWLSNQDRTPTGGVLYVLTAEGRRVAEARGLVRRAEQ